MENNIRSYVDALFKNFELNQETAELKEEITQNSLDKFQDLISAGQDESTAYKIVINSIGDVSKLIYNMDYSENSQNNNNAEMQKYKQRSAILTSVAIFLYIVCIVPILFLQDEVGVILLFVFIGIATAMLIFNDMTKPKYLKENNSTVEDFKEWQYVNKNNYQMYKSISNAVSILSIAIYFVVSFITHAWYITWVIFLIMAAVKEIIKCLFQLKGAK